MTEAIFTREGDAYVPTRLAGSPWTAGALHGGPPAGLLAYSIERHVDDPAFQFTRLTVDLFRAVPQAPLHVRARTTRSGRRIHVVQASILAHETEVARGSGLLLRRSQMPGADGERPPPPGPDGIETTGGIARPPRLRTGGSPSVTEFRPRFPGFHTTIETRWVAGPDSEAPPTVWMRIPVPFIEGEEISPVVRAAALSDFGNALANQTGRLAYINADITLHLHRDPVGGWLCLQHDSRHETGGVGFVESIWFDEAGRWGRGVQSRLANPT